MTVTEHKERSIPDVYDQGGTGNMHIWFDHFTWGRIADETHQGVEHPRVEPWQPTYFRGHQVTDGEKHAFWGHRKSGKDPEDPYGSDRELFDIAFKGQNQSTWIPDPLTDSSYDVGGGFSTRRETMIAVNPADQHITATQVVPGSGIWSGEYTGPIFCTWPQFLGLPPSYERDLEPWGTVAINRCRPTNNVAAAATALIELYREGLPKMFGIHSWKERTHILHKAGDEYLNKEFGWDPLVADIRNVAYSVRNAHTILDQYERDSGRVVRRGFTFPVSETSETVDVGSTYPAMGSGGNWSNPPNSTLINPGPNLFYSQGARLLRTRSVYKKTWFSGAFTYHLPVGYNSRNQMVRAARQAQHLLGLDLTPEVLWNATPWTWAVDWFSNAGDVVSNLSSWAVDGLVMKYGYIMEHTLVQDRYHCTANAGLFDPHGSPSDLIVSVETKRREKASPFGFQVAWSELTPRQMAISIALGLTKGFR